ncbi:MAG: helix-turn-helix transcriptional regulator [Kiloniellales bacterium]|nr:helix-turn-helix transcriptional regulator [Kiloniellales bacterium]
MTPFGRKLRNLREERRISLKEMARGLQVSAAYLSAMEHGHRGKPSKRFVHRVCQYLGIIWDEAEELERLANISHPRVVVDTSGLRPEATELANLFAERVASMTDAQLDRWLKELRAQKIEED